MKIAFICVHLYVINVNYSAPWDPFIDNNSFVCRLVHVMNITIILLLGTPFIDNKSFVCRLVHVMNITVILLIETPFIDNKSIVCRLVHVMNITVILPTRC